MIHLMHCIIKLVGKVRMVKAAYVRTGGIGDTGTLERNLLEEMSGNSCFANICFRRAKVVPSSS